MAIRHPKPKQIRLPFDVPRPKKGEEAPARVCGICRTADSRYTCPRCNVAYCSLACFREPSHAQCSEPFYRSTIAEEIASDPKTAAEEKRKMMDMLRRFEEAAADGEDALAALEDEDEEDELVKALEGVDFDNIDSNTLLKLLPQEHRDAFLTAIQNPESSAARELLDSAVNGGEGEEEILPVPNVLPWFAAELPNDDTKRFAPEPQEIPASETDKITPPSGVGGKLVYNLLAMCIAYMHVLFSLRLPSLSSTYLAAQDITATEVKDEFSALLPFLAAKSTLRYSSAREAWSAVWEAINADSPQPRAGLVFLLDKVAPLFHPPITLDPPRVTGLLADVFGLFSQSKVGQVGKKLAFYAVAFRQLGREEWLGLEKEVSAETDKLRDELAPESEQKEEQSQLRISQQLPPQQAKIELLD